MDPKKMKMMAENMKEAKARQQVALRAAVVEVQDGT